MEIVVSQLSNFERTKECKSGEASPATGGNSPTEDLPSFLPRKGILLREYHVLVVWPDGRREKTGRFCRRLDAVRWIKEKSAEWLDRKNVAENSDEPAIRVEMPEQSLQAPIAADG